MKNKTLNILWVASLVLMASALSGVAIIYDWRLVLCICLWVIGERLETAVIKKWNQNE